MKILLGILLSMIIVVLVLGVGILIVISYEVIRDMIYDIRDTSEKRKIRRNEEKE